MFEGVWILRPDILEFRFYSIYFKAVWILLPKIWEVRILHSKIS